jgi:putative lipoprotein
MSRQTVAALAAACSLLVSWGCAARTAADAGQSQAATLAIIGRLTYRERIALPAGTVALVEVRETSTPDGAVVAEQRVDLSGRQVPIPFEVIVDRSKLPVGPYTVRGTLLEGNRPAWISDPLVIESASAHVDLGTVTLTRVGTQPPAETTVLQGTAWVVENIGDAGIVSGSRVTIMFGPDGRVSGNASCNNFTGSYAHTAEGLSLTQMAATQKACLAPELTTQETVFLEMLHQVTRFDLDSGLLVLRTADGREITARRG